MFEQKELQDLQDYFLNLDSRGAQAVFFCRISGYSSEIQAFIQKYYEAARIAGVVIEGRIPNPDERNLDYYEEIMGMEFQMSTGFISASLKKWLPRMRDYQRNQVALSIYDTLEDMRREGKNENMLKNAYIKFMCWLYYKFERIVNSLGENSLPKILYEGEVSNYELKLLNILSHAGCDIVLLQYRGDENYLKLDPASRFSRAWQAQNLGPFRRIFPFVIFAGRWNRKGTCRGFTGRLRRFCPVPMPGWKERYRRISERIPGAGGRIPGCFTTVSAGLPELRTN